MFLKAQRGFFLRANFDEMLLLRFFLKRSFSFRLSWIITSLFLLLKFSVCFVSIKPCPFHYLENDEMYDAAIQQLFHIIIIHSTAYDVLANSRVMPQVSHPCSSFTCIWFIGIIRFDRKYFSGLDASFLQEGLEVYCCLTAFSLSDGLQHTFSTQLLFQVIRCLASLLSKGLEVCLFLSASLLGECLEAYVPLLSLFFLGRIRSLFAVMVLVFFKALYNHIIRLFRRRSRQV